MSKEHRQDETRADLDVIEEGKGWACLQDRLVLTDSVMEYDFEFIPGLKLGIGLCCASEGNLMVGTKDPHVARLPMKRGGKLLLRAISDFFKVRRRIT